MALCITRKLKGFVIVTCAYPAGALDAVAIHGAFALERLNSL